MFDRKLSSLLMISALISLFVVSTLTSCGGSSSPIMVTVTAAASTVDGKDTTTLTATVENDRNAAGVTWSTTAGTLSNESTTSATLTAPAAASSAQTITVTATSVAEATRSGTATVTVAPAPSVTSSSTSLTGSVGSTFSVQLQGSGGIPPYKNWAVYTAGGGNPLPSCLTLSSAGVITTASGTAPTASCAGSYSNLYFQFTDSGAPTPMTATSSALTITITAPSITFTPTLPQGTVGTAYAGSVAATGPVGATTYSVASGVLPADLSLNGSTGAITGMPKAADVGTANFTIKVVDAYGDTATSGNLSISIPAPVITFPSSLAGGTVGTAYASSVAASGVLGTSTYSLASGALPASGDLALNSGTGAISGTPRHGDVGTYTITVKVVDAYGDTATSGSLSITIVAAQAITFGAAPTATATFGVAYASSVSASGGAGTLTLSVASGAMPPDLSLNTGTGAISGTPKAADIGTFTFAVQAADAYGDSATSPSYSIVISYPAVTITPGSGSLPLAVTGQSYSQALTAGGGSGAGYTWTVTGLPANGLSFSATGATLTISGQATNSGTVSFTASVTDGAGNSAGPLSYSIQVYSPVTLPAANPASLPSVATVNLVYSGTVVATGGSGNYTWTVTGLSDGLSSSSSGGTLTISGAPTSAATVSFNASVKDTTTGVTAGPITYTITVYATVTLPATNPSTLGPAIVSTPYTGTIAAAGGSGNYSWTVTGFPQDGLSYSTSGATLTVSGTAAATGTVSFTAKVTDTTTNQSSGPYTYTIGVYNALTQNASGLPLTATVNTAYSGSVTASGGTGTGYTWTVTGLPADGLSYTASAGTLTISGTPTSAQAVQFTVKVTDSAGNSAGPTSYTINAYNALSLPATNPATLGPATINALYSGTIVATGGSGNYAWTVTGFPQDGLNDSASGGTLTISGTPTSAATVSFTASVKDTTTGVTVGPYNYSVTVYSTLTLPSPNPVSLPSYGTVSTAYSGTITAAGGSGNYSFTVTGLSDNLTSSASGGTLTISGTPASTATVSINVSVKDTTTGITVGPYTYTITVYNGLSLPAPNPSTLGSATINIAYTGTIVATGGSGNYSWTVTGLPADGLNSSASGGTLTISGTPTSATTVSFGASVKDTTTGVTVGPNTYTVTVYSQLTVSTTTLPSGDAQSAYSAQLQAAGGTGTGYTWSVTSGSLPGGLALNSSTGAITGTPSAATSGGDNFTVQVKDSANNTATQPLTLVIYLALSLPSPDPASLPSTGYTGVAYGPGYINASGGSGSYSWSTSGLSDSLAVSGATNGSTLTIAGTPTAAQTVTFSATVTDSTTGYSITQTGYNVTISNPTPVSLPSPNPSSLGSATVSQSYNGYINAAGGVPPYTWSINGTTVSSSGPTVGDGLNATNSGSNTLSISGTPGSTGTVTLTNVKVVDSLNTSATQTYSIAVNSAGSQVSGNIGLMSFCGNTSNFTMPTFTVSINTSPVQTTTTDSSGNYSFATIPNGTYTITPSITGPSSLFSPATLTNVVVDNGAVSNENFLAELGYTVSGTISYGGSSTGQIYLLLNNNSCGPSNGTSISAAGAFTIHGVLPGSYSLSAWMDTMGFGQPNASGPSSSSMSLTVSDANLTGQSVNMTNPGAITLSGSPSLSTPSAFAEGVVLPFKPITTSGSNGNSVETPTSYTVQWSASSTFTTLAGSASFAAQGANGNNVWFVNVANVSGLTAGGSYYFRAQGVNGSSTSSWSSTVGPVTIAAPSAANTVSGQVSWSGTATGPLYVGFYNNSTNQAWMTQVGTKAAPPTSPASYSVEVPSGTIYLFGLVDQNNNGMFAPGDITNISGKNGPLSVTISGNQTENLALPNAGSIAIAPVTYNQTTNGTSVNSGYSLYLGVYGEDLLPVAVTLESGPNLINPVDLEMCQDCGGSSAEFNYNNYPNGAIPKVGDTYSFQVTYSNKTTATLTAAVTGWNNTTTIVGASDVATLTSPAGSNVSETPGFNWTYPANAADYTYEFWVCCTGNNQNNGEIWSIPANNSNANGFTSSQITPPLAWGVDPTNSSNTPSPSTLSGGSSYSWALNAMDSIGNEAQAQMDFTTTPSGPLALPAANPSSLPSATVGVAYSGSITATGGVQPYQYGVNDTCFGCNSYPLGNGSLGVTNGYGTTLTIGGTPSTETASGSPVSFELYVQDSTGTVAGPVTYTITVLAGAPVSLPAASSNPLPSGVVGETYSGAINASGGAGGGNYEFVVNGTTIPTNNTPTSIANGDGLTATNSGGNTLSFGGTPVSTESSLQLTVEVIDTTNTSDTATVTYTIAITPLSSLAFSINSVPQGMVNMPYTFSNLDISGGVSPYTVTYSNLPAGLEQSSSSIVGTPTSSGSTTVSVRVVDSDSNTTSGTFTLPVVPETVAANNSELKGQYACYLEEYWPSGVTVGSSMRYRGGGILAIAVNGSGAITGGEGDHNGPESGYSTTSTLSGTYSVGADNRGYLLVNVGGSQPVILAMAGGNLDSSGQFTEFAITEMDDAGSSPSGTTGTGHCYLQNTSPALNTLTPSGGYVYGLNAEDGSGNLETVVGSLQYGNGGTTLSFVQDIGDAGAYTGDMTGSGTVTSTPDAYGRMTFSAGPSGQTASPTVIYITNNSAGEAVIMSANSHNATSNANFAIGQARAQNAAALSATYPLSGSMVMYSDGLETTLTGYKSLVSPLSINSSSGAYTVGPMLMNEEGTFRTQASQSGTWSYTANSTTGRMPFGDAGDVIYVYNTSSAVVLMADVGNGGGTTAQDQLGWIEPQTAPSSGTWAVSDLATSYFFNTVTNGDYTKDQQSGVASIASSGSVTEDTVDDGGRNWADWDEFICGSQCAGGSATFVPDTTYDPSGTLGIFDFKFTQNSTTQTVSYCAAISVDKATNASTRGRAVCLDATSSSPQLTIVQE